MSWIGAKWWRFDFHTHSPASLDYGRGDESSRNISPKAWLMNFIEHGIECVAVTDHNTGEWISSLKLAAEELRLEGHTIHLFPGVEITGNSNVHILAIFDPSASQPEIESIIGAAGYRGRRGDSNAVAEKSPEQIVEEIKKSKGVAIPAHIDLNAGLCQIESSHTIRQTASISSAVEVIYPHSTESLTRYRNLQLGIPEVIGSDSHHPSEVGRAFTWVKMGTPNIEGLRLALIDGQSSIKRFDMVQQNPNATSSLLISSVTVTNSKYAGRNAPFTINFNPWLNSIIGGRGSGKSSLLEFIRLTMQRGKELLDLTPTNDIRQVFERFAQISSARDDVGVMLHDTEISCDYQKQNSKYRLRWRSNTAQTEIFYWSGSEWVLEHGDVASRFPVKIFSQKQIFNLAQHPNFLLKLVDQSEYVNYQAWKIEWNEKESEFLRLASQRRELLAQIENKFLIEGQLADVIRRITAIENSGHDHALSSFQASISKINDIRSFITLLDTQRSNLHNALYSVVPPPPPQTLNPATPEDAEVLAEITNVYQKYAIFANSMRDELQKLEQQTQHFSHWFEGCKLHGIYLGKKQSYDAMVASLQINGVSNPHEYQELVNQKLQLQIKLVQISETENLLRGITDALTNSHKNLSDLRSALSVRRHEFLVTNFSGGNFISVQLNPFANNESLDSTFRQSIGRLDNAFANDIYDEDRSLGILFRLHNEINNSNQGRDISDITNLRVSIIGSFRTQLLHGNSGSILGQQIGKRFSDFISLLSHQVRDAFSLWFPEDELIVKFNDGTRFRDISQGSAGQKSAAILSFLLSYGDEPLLLDQPEDDLDNGLVSSLIVAKLQSCKTARQIIVATHNPNIVVNGDSDYLIALQQNRGQMQVTSSGALQEAAIRHDVCEIMEGGKQALEQRYRRMINL